MVYYKYIIIIVFVNYTSRKLEKKSITPALEPVKTGHTARAGPWAESIPGGATETLSQASTDSQDTDCSGSPLPLLGDRQRESKARWDLGTLTTWALFCPSAPGWEKRKVCRPVPLPTGANLLTSQTSLQKGHGLDE